MNPIFGRWLPAIAETTVTRWLPAIAQNRAVRRIPAVAETVTARWLPALTQSRAVRHLPALAETPLVRRSALAVAGLTCAAACSAVAGGPPGTVAAVPGHLAPESAAYTQQLRADGSAQDRGSDAQQNQNDTPSRETLVPYGVQGAQSHIALDGDQWDNAREIVRVARDEGVGPRGAVIGVATSLQESKLRNLGHLGAYNDHDSLGLFQQRPSSGWGAPDQLTDRDYSARAFFEGLKRVDGWRDMPLTDAAQAVQVSAYPFAYAQWEDQAADIVQQVWSDAH
ncbi:hypothetical protein [Micromonospora sp. HM5-17]|jgi:hypothetical protein|uniref:hypothetical protein n=1 Tax=Micromonospora sp. HM5-17 TaxID=2487710 RepID=UPI000F48E9CB|nr:hypothetical protein [Micromonospora sp. HM5-17]ROT29515.1 hypothetical protein EF879_17730 [Micromonospora sp. HM5-17]